MNRQRGPRLRTLAAALGCVSVLVPLAAERPTHAVLIKAPKPYDALVTTIVDAGGHVTHQYEFVDGLAADVADDALTEIERLVGPGNIGRDEVLLVPAIHDPRAGEPFVGQVEADEIVPQADLGNVEAQNAEGTGFLEGRSSEDVESQSLEDTDPLGFRTSSIGAAEVVEANSEELPGANVVIAVIDSGYRPLVGLEPLPHELDRLILPGFSFVPGATEPPAISNANFPQGTQVAAIAAANKPFCLGANLPNPTARLVAVAESYGLAVASPSCSATSRLIQVIGSAPGARILPMKVIPRTGGGAPASRVIQAIDRAIALRRDFNNNLGGIDIKVVNIGLGGPTNAAARTLFDQAIDRLIEADIVPVVSAGNDGFSSLTISSPATSLSALTVGAASIATHERIFRAQFSVPCNVVLPLSAVRACTETYRPDDHIQIAEFSSRGPTHDGRINPHVVANGVGVFTQGSGTATTLDLANVTWAATANVAGTAAVLRQQFPDATARQIRNAIIMSANPATVPTATPNDQGAGFVDKAAAAALLQAGTVPNTVPAALFTPSVPANMQRAGRPVQEGVASIAFTNIRPAEIADVPFLVPPKTGRLHVRIHSILPVLPPAEQNQFFGDDVFLRIQSAAVHRRDRRVDNVFLAAGTDTSYSFDRPEPGVWRITPSGDWTNAGPISFAVEVWTADAASPQHTVKADIAEGAQHVYDVAVPPATSTLDVRLDWVNMEARYPFSDLDVILTPPVGAPVNSCNTTRAPERCTVANPAAGKWTVRVVGLTVPSFGLPGNAETYTLRLTADGTLLKLVR